MHCYVCARQGVTTDAIAICKNCGVGLCMLHLAEMQDNRPGGTEISCPHTLPTPRDIDTTVAREGVRRV